MNRKRFRLYVMSSESIAIISLKENNFFEEEGIIKLEFNPEQILLNENETELFILGSNSKTFMYNL